MLPPDDMTSLAALWHAVRSDLRVEELWAFRSSGALCVPQAIAVYKNAYWARQHAVLAELFPLVVERLGAVRFRELVRRYLLAVPSSHPELEHLGDRLPAFLRASSDEDLASVAALAGLEQARTEAALSPDDPAAHLTDIVPATFASARLSLVRSLRIVELDVIALSTLHAHGLEVVGASYAVVARPRFAVTTHLVAREERALLAHVARGATMGELLEHLAHDVPALHRPLDAWFRRGWIAAIEVAR